MRNALTVLFAAVMLSLAVPTAAQDVAPDANGNPIVPVPGGR